VQPQISKQSQIKRVLTDISNFRRLGELRSKQRAVEISFKSLKFMFKKSKLRSIQGVGSFTGTTPAAKYWRRTEELP